MLDSLDLASVRAWAVAAAASLDRRRHEIDALNVFPIADADTGTNMAVTMRAGSDALAAAVADRSVADGVSALGALARGAALSARGNSGVIMAELLGGLAAGVAGAADCDATRLRAALDQAATSAYAAVGAPAEGPILSVVRAAAVGVGALPVQATLADVVRCARDDAVAALARTPSQLAVLATAGVVDAGGRGLVVVLDALCGVVTGDPSVLGDANDDPEPALAIHSSATFGYEVQYLLDASTTAVTTLRATLSALGDSLTVAQIEPGLWNVHVHVDDVGAAIEAGLTAGRPRQISVTRFADQARADQSGSSLVVLLLNDGLRELFEASGAQVLIVDADDEAAVRAALPRGRCVLLPMDEQLLELAATVAVAARADGVDLAVVPCRSPMQGLAAAAVHDPSLRAEDDVIAMAEAAAATRYARIEIAAGAGLTTVGPCRAGDVLGLIDSEVVEIGAEAGAITEAVLERLLGVGGDLVTAVINATAFDALEVVVRECVARRAPFAELAIYADAQLDCLALLALE